MREPLLRLALARAGLLGAASLVVKPMPSPSRNRVWLVDADGERLVMKLQHEGASVPTVAREAEILRGLAGAAVPRLRAAGTVGAGIAFVVTELMPGVPLAQRLADRTEEGRELLTELARWLHDFAARADAAGAGVRSANPRLTGPWSATYSPGAAPPVVSGTRAGRNRIGLVHGSFDPGNILVLDGFSLRLAGVLDFEAARRGPPLIDVAGLALHLLLRERPDMAETWLGAAATVWGWERMPAAALPYMRAQNDRRREADAADAAVASATDAALHAFGLRLAAGAAYVAR